jgi:uncharacterized membrane protein
VQTVSELVVANYHDPFRAAQVLDTLRYWHAEWSADLENAIVFVKRADGKPQLQPAYSPEQQSQAGAFLCTLLDTFFLPIAGPEGPANRQHSNEARRTPGKTLNAAWWQQVGLADEFVHQVRRMIRPGDSGLLMLIRASDPDLVIDEIHRYGGRLLQASVNLYQDTMIPQDTVDGRIFDASGV